MRGTGRKLEALQHTARDPPGQPEMVISLSHYCRNATSPVTQSSFLISWSSGIKLPSPSPESALLILPPPPETNFDACRRGQICFPNRSISSTIRALGSGSSARPAVCCRPISCVLDRQLLHRSREIWIRTWRAWSRRLSAPAQGSALPFPRPELASANHIPRRCGGQCSLRSCSSAWNAVWCSKQATELFSGSYDAKYKVRMAAY